MENTTTRWRHPSMHWASSSRRWSVAQQCRHTSTPLPWSLIFTEKWLLYAETRNRRQRNGHAHAPPTGATANRPLPVLDTQTYQKPRCIILAGLSSMRRRSMPFPSINKQLQTLDTRFEAPVLLAYLPAIGLHLAGYHFPLAPTVSELRSASPTPLPMHTWHSLPC